MLDRALHSSQKGFGTDTPARPKGLVITLSQCRGERKSIHTQIYVPGLACRLSNTEVSHELGTATSPQVRFYGKATCS